MILKILEKKLYQEGSGQDSQTRIPSRCEVPTWKHGHSIFIDSHGFPQVVKSPHRRKGFVPLLFGLLREVALSSPPEIAAKDRRRRGKGEKPHSSQIGRNNSRAYNTLYFIFKFSLLLFACSHLSCFTCTSLEWHFVNILSLHLLCNMFLGLFIYLTHIFSLSFMLYCPFSLSQSFLTLQYNCHYP